MGPVRALVLAAVVVAAPAVAETIDVRPELAFQGTTPYRTSVTAHPGDVIRVELPAEASIGYQWSTTVEGDAVRPGRSETGPADRPGAPRRQIQSYVPAALGTARITFVYRRPWDTSSVPARQVVLDVEVTPAPEQPAVAPGAGSVSAAWRRAG